MFFRKLNFHSIVGKFLSQTEIQFKAKKQKVGWTSQFSGWKKKSEVASLGVIARTISIQLQLINSTLI